MSTDEQVRSDESALAAEVTGLLSEWRSTCRVMGMKWTDKDAGAFIAAALAHRVDTAEVRTLPAGVSPVADRVDEREPLGDVVAEYLLKALTPWRHYMAHEDVNAIADGLAEHLAQSGVISMVDHAVEGEVTGEPARQALQTKPCHWCGKPSTGTAMTRVPTPAGWGTELGGRFASCGKHGIGWSVWSHLLPGTEGAS